MTKTPDSPSRGQTRRRTRARALADYKAALRSKSPQVRQSLLDGSWCLVSSGTDALRSATEGEATMVTKESVGQDAKESGHE